MPLTTMFVEVAISVTELARIVANARGMSKRDALTAQAGRNPADHWEQKSSRRRIAHQGAERQAGHHDDGERAAWPGGGASHDDSAGRFDCARLDERGSQDEQPEKHQNGLTAKAGERLVGGEQAR